MTTADGLFDLRGKRALIAGASRGIGEAVAARLAAAGAATILAGRSLSALEDQVARLRAAGVEAAALELDVADPGSLRAVEQLEERVDVLVNVAGTNVRKPIEQVTREDYARLMDVNLHGIVGLTRAVGGRMVAQGSGKVITVGSLAGALGIAHNTVYGIAKAGLVAMTRGLAAEWGRFGVQVNCVMPGFVRTEMTSEVWASPAMHDWLERSQALPRLGEPEDIAGPVVFLASRASDYVTGHVLAVDGGFSATVIPPYASS